LISAANKFSYDSSRSMVFADSSRSHGSGDRVHANPAQKALKPIIKKGIIV
jgi:hypothetical protein